MIGNAYRTRRAISTIALIAGGHLVVSGTTAEPAAGQSASEAGNGGWLTQSAPSVSRIGRAEDQADAYDAGADAEKKIADNSADPAAGRSGSETREVGWSNPARLGAPPVDPAGYRADTFGAGTVSQSGSAAGNGGWSTQVQPAASGADPAAGQADAQDVDASTEEKTADNTADAATGQSASAADNGGWSTQVQPAAASDDPAAGQSSEAREAGWVTQATGRASWVDSSSSANYLGATKNETADTAANSAAGEGDGGEGNSSDGGFQSDPQYEPSYNAEGNVDVYGAKTAIAAPRPLLEIGREQYTSGSYGESSTLLGEKNPLLPGLSIYGDWRTAIAFNQNNGKDIAQIATRLNLDVDFKITGTERIHAFFTPLQDNAQFTRFEFGGSDGNEKFNGEFDYEPQTLFFEGDLGSLYSGFSGKDASFDLPFTVGLFPLFLQNGIWANDAILGAAFSIPAKNSPFLALANFDVTFFGAFDNVDNAALGADNHSANLYGATAFIDAFSGYIETGYGLVQGVDEQDDVLTHFVTAAYSRRYYNTLSNTTRVFGNFGDGEDNDGLAIISENSLISGLPSTLLPYANFFVGFGAPQPLVDGNGAGILKNVGINFETDALTGFPKLDDTGSNTFGGAIGLEYLFNLDQQIVFEFAMVQPFEDDGIGAQDPQYGVGVRYQVPLTLAWLFRADATYQILDGGDEDNFGLRAELRRKF